MFYRKIIIILLLVVSSNNYLSSAERCICRFPNGNNLTTYTYWVNSGDCCSGAVNDFMGGLEHNYTLGSEGVWILTGTNTLSASTAQSTCCSPTGH